MAGLLQRRWSRINIAWVDTEQDYYYYYQRKIHPLKIIPILIHTQLLKIMILSKLIARLQKSDIIIIIIDENVRSVSWLKKNYRF